MAVAVELLTQGFPAKAAAVWTAFFDRLQQLGSNAKTGVPIGYLLPGGGGDTGVIVTPACYRDRPDGTRGLVVNLSSWYVAPPDRWRAGLMLQGVLRRHDALFSDLTPTPEVRAMLPKFGFKAINSGVFISVVPLSAAQPAGKTRVRAMAEHEPQIPEAVLAMMEDHRAVGCLPGVVEDAVGAMPVLFRRRALKGAPAAKLIYCPDMQRFQNAMPAVARFLFRRGVAILLFDDTGLPGHSGLLRRPRGLKFIKPGAGLAYDPTITDYTASELALLDL